jgi:PHD/YefM family antitoxin component YafN of YafNO toxin-antitoxin module
MAITTLTSREFNHDTGRAKKAAKKGPVFITDRGQPSHVLLTVEEYRKLTPKKPRTLLDAIGMEESAEIEFEIPRLGDEHPVPADID